MDSFQAILEAGIHAVAGTLAVAGIHTGHSVYQSKSLRLVSSLFFSQLDHPDASVAIRSRRIRHPDAS